MKHIVVCVDDEKDTLDALGRLFRKDFEVLKFTNAKEALNAIKTLSRVAVIISDQRMPVLTGVEFLDQSRALHPEAVRILLTGYTDIESAIQAINSGQVYRYITKPWDPSDLLATVKEACEKYALIRALDEKNIELTRVNKQLKELDQAKSDFMILINHELKTPLTSLSSFLDLLAETELSTDQSHYLKRIIEAKERLNKMIHEILLLMQSQTGQLEMNLVLLDAAKILEKQAVKLKIPHSGTQKVSQVFADEQLLTLVFTELMENMEKHTSNADTMKVSIASNDEETTIEFKNEARKFSEEELEDLSKPFRQSESIFNHSSGLGLGLPLARSLAILLGFEFKTLSDSRFFTVQLVRNSNNPASS